MTVYLPDELGRWAKDAGLPLSRMLRSAVEAERAAREAADTTDAVTRTVTVTDGEGSYRVRLHGVVLADEAGVLVMLGTDARLYVCDGGTGSLLRDADPERLQGVLPEGAYLAVLRGLGREPVIDLGVKGA